MELSSKDIERLEETGYRREEFAVIGDGATRSETLTDGAFSTVSLIRNAESKEKDPWDAISILSCIWPMKVPWLMGYAQWDRRFLNKN